MFPSDYFAVDFFPAEFFPEMPDVLPGSTVYLVLESPGGGSYLGFLAPAE